MQTIEEVHLDPALTRPDNGAETEMDDVKPDGNKSVPAKHAGKSKKIFLVLIALAVIGGGTVIGAPLINELMSYVDTDDAYVTSHIHNVSPKIAGTVAKVLVIDNQFVKAGQVIALIDPADQLVAVQKAKAHLLKMQNDALASGKFIDYAMKNASAAGKTAVAGVSSAKSAINKAEQQINETRSSIASARQVLNQRDAELVKSELDLTRYLHLEKQGAVTTEELNGVQRDEAVAVSAKQVAIESIAQANAKLNQAYADLATAKSQLVQAQATGMQAEAADMQVSVNEHQHDSSDASIQEAQSELADAQLKLSYTVIKASVSGRVGRKSVEEGQRVQSGTPLLSIVSPEKWIVASFKETQLGSIRPNQPVKITVDAFKNQEFKGHVDSFSPASGAQFSLLPPDNATGNFTKVVQRLPVKILFDRDSLKNYEKLIAPGLSCVVKVKIK